ncbi:hypothetical protein [Gottfriedia luciferensis]|uniref:hypothetical protein n=1 Tax=Gottfriedia luciferensis TaxID=178774 RepID=UPI0034A0B7D7
MGNPDLAILKYKIVFFLCFMFSHSCPLHGNKPSSNLEYCKNLKRKIASEYEVISKKDGV